MTRLPRLSTDLCGSLKFLAALTLISACADPMEPPPPPPVDEVRYTFTVSADSLEAVGTCESIVSVDQSIGGPIDGDFGYSFRAFWPDGTSSVIAQTTGYPNPGALWQAVKGAKHRWTDRIVVKTVAGSALPPVRLELQATEFDWNVLARQWVPDAGLNGIRHARSHGNSEGVRAALIAQGDTRASIDGADVEGCALRVHYSYSAGRTGGSER
jgi:hypothetical protein